MADSPRRGDLWLVTLGAARAGEPGKTRPAVVVSSDELLIGAPNELIVVVPVSSSRAPSQLRIDLPADFGLDRPSRAICRAVRSVNASRLARRLGQVDAATMRQIEEALEMILAIDPLSTQR